MPKKAVYATDEELQIVKQELQALIAKVDAAKAPKEDPEKAAQKVRDELNGLKDVVEQNKVVAAEETQAVDVKAHAHTEERVQNVLDEVNPQFGVEIERAKAAEEAINVRLDENIAAVRKELSDHLTQLCAKIEEEFNDTREKIYAEIIRQAEIAEVNLKAMRKEVQPHWEKIEREAKADRAEIRKEVKDVIAAVRAEEIQACEAQDVVTVANKAELHTRIDSIYPIIDENKRVAYEDDQLLRIESYKALVDYAIDTDAHLEILDGVGNNLQAALNEVQMIPTRRVEWFIPRASVVLQPRRANGSIVKETRSWFSEKFDAAGCVGMQLELQLLPPDEPEEGVPVNTNDCALLLWADKGTQAAFRLFIGDKFVTQEKVFTERMGHGPQRLCILKDAIRKSDNTLAVGVEFLEMIRESQPPKVEALGGVEVQKIELDESSLTFHRHLNHRVLPQVRKEVERMQARMVRQVEWNLEQASSLPKYFPPGQAICSPPFNAAGVEGMQLCFYPCGYKGATDGFCSLFLYCPAGTTIKSQLSLGKQKRDASHTYEEAGAHGRTNYCRFEGLADEDDDTLLITLEIEDCRQEVKATVGEGSAIGSEVKLARKPGKNALVDIKTIPALWTAQALGDMVKAPDGYQPFSALKAARKAALKRPTADTDAHRSGSAPSAPAADPYATGMSAPQRRPADGYQEGMAATQRSESMPSFRSPQPQVSPPSPDSLPLLFSKTQGSDWGGDRNLGRRQRGGKRPVMLVAPPMHAAAPT